MQEVCYDVSTEPRLQPLSNETLEGRSDIREENARVDVAPRCFWSDGSQKAYFDTRVYLTMEPQTVYLRQEKERRRQYHQRIWEVEHGSFTPLVFSTTGGMGRAASVTLKRLVAQIVEKRREAYSQVVAWIRTRVSFSLLRLSITALRGCRTKKTGYISLPTAALVVNECRLHWIFLSSLCKKKNSHETHHTSFMYTSHFFIRLVWFSSVSHTSHNLLLSTEYSNLSNLLC